MYSTSGAARARTSWVAIDGKRARATTNELARPRADEGTRVFARDRTEDAFNQRWHFPALVSAPSRLSARPLIAKRGTGRDWPRVAAARRRGARLHRHRDVWRRRD